MAGDLPPGKWSSVLVGAWWPAAPTVLHDSARQWSQLSAQQEQFSQGLHSTMTGLTRNKGLTADDLVEQYRDGTGKHLDLAEKYATKSRAFGSAADAIDHLRSGLRSIADEYNKKIEEAEKSAHGNAISRALAITRIAELITEANGQAASKSASTVSALTSALQSILTAESSSLSPNDFMQSQGIQANEAKPPNAQLAAENGMKNFGNAADGGSTPAEAAGYQHDNAGVDKPALGAGGDGNAGPEGPRVSPAANVTGGGDHVPAISGAGGVHAPGGGAHVPSGGVPGAGGLSPAALGNGLSPASLSKGFEAGAQAGQPAAAGAQSVAGSAVHAAAPPPAAAPEAPPVAPRAIPTLAAGGDGGFGANQHAASAASTPTVTASDHYAAAPTVVAAPMSAPAVPVSGAPVAPAGPLPAYGSDLRPMAAAPPPVPAAPAGPVAGAPVAASPASSPSAGGLVSPVERSTPAATAGAQGNASATAGAGLAAASAGAVAGDAAKRAGAQRDLQSKVDAMARQEPAIAWAAGLLDDDVTTLLTTDLAGGWVPPHVKLPAGITLLAPSARRRGISAVDLLGPVTVAAAYQPHGYIADPGPNDPAMTGERARYGHYVDELGPTLVSALTRRTGLGSTQGAAKAAIRGTGVLEHEVTAMRAELGTLRHEVIGTYPQHKPELLANWMLLSAVEAVVDGHKELAHYHLAWYLASFATTAGQYRGV